MTDYDDRVKAARHDLADWIERNLDVLTPNARADAQLPVVDDFVLAVAVSDAANGDGDGLTYIGRISSARGSYRTFGLLRAVEVAYAQIPPDDD